MNYREFLKKLGNPDPICFVDNNIVISLKDVPKYINEHEIFFLPNVGGTTIAEIKEFKAFFVDLDAGKISKDEFLPVKAVKKYKSEKWKEINSFAIPPSFVVETRNGLHLYWKIQEEISLELWQSIEDALVKWFDGDKNVKNAAKQLRLPGSVWRKNPKYPEYPCRVLKENDVYTYIASYCKLFNISESGAQTTSETTSEKHTKSHHANTTAPKRKPISPQVFTNYKQLFDYLTKEISMFDYLQEFHKLVGNNQRSFCCIIHPDKHPSASIFKVDSGVELYCCNASSCGFKGNIIQVVSKLKDCSRSDAITFICKNLNIRYEIDRRLESLLEDNKHTISDDIKYSHTDLYSAIYRYKPTLEKLHDIAKDSLEYSHTEGKFLFTSSIQHITEKMGRRDKKNTTSDIGFLCLLKLIEKVDLDTDTDVPKEFESYVKRFQHKHNKDNYITVFSIPSYTYNVLTECEGVAKQVKEKGLRKTHFSYETVANAFDKETADRVFPQIKGKSVKSIDEFLLQTINILLERDGYFSLNTVKSFYSDNDVFFKEKTYIRQLPAIMQQLDLQKIKASKKIKEEYKILSMGYPYIYIKKGN
ncbi:MAG: hypothetical protein E7419_06780 [Ruminococcaceae bacterium]|nr:hypothetical protein [Oscillospiraceae bacterium]